MDSKATRTLSRRQALRLAATGTAVAAAGSMLTTATAAPKPESRVGRARRQTEPVTLRVLDWQSGGKDFWDTTDALFMEQNPGIKVEHEAVPYGQYFGKVGAYVAADDGPDLMQLEVGLGTLKYKDVLVPLNDHVGDIFDNINGTSAFCDNFDCSTQIYGVPHTNQGHMVYFNTGVFQEAGLDPENPPRTWSEFDDAAQQIRAVNKQVFAFGGKEWASLWTWSNLPHQTATAEEQRGLYTGDVKWTDEPWRNTWALFDDMVQRGWFPEGAARPMSPRMRRTASCGATPLSSTPSSPTRSTGSSGAT